MSFGIPVRNGLAVGLLASTFLSSRRAAYPAMSLNFLQPFLDSRITFTRGSNATLVDATGRITYAPANLVLYSTLAGGTGGTIGSGAVPPTGWTFVAGTGVVAYRADPQFGGTIIDFSGTAQRPYIGQTVAVSANTNYIFSLYAAENTGQIAANVATLASIPVGSVLTFYVNGVLRDASVYSPVAGDRLVYLLQVAATAGTAQLRVGLGASSNSTGTCSVSAPQFEPVTYQTTPSPYVPTTASAYYGPRFDYDPVTLAPKGLLIEEQRTNLVTYSNDFADASWGAFGAKNLVANTTTSPDGGTNASTLTDNSAVAFQGIQKTFTIANDGATYSASVYVRKTTGGTSPTFGVNLQISGGTSLTAQPRLNTDTGVLINGTGTVQNAGAYWRLTCSLTNNTTGNTTLSQAIFPATASHGVSTDSTTATGSAIIYGAQLEAGAFATSYIPTVASTVTRSADVATMTGTNFSSWYNQSEGTFVANYQLAASTISQDLFMANAGAPLSSSVGIYIASGTSSLGWARNGGVTQCSIPTSISSSANNKTAFGYATNDFSIAANGTIGTPDTSGTVPTVDRLTFGANNVAGPGQAVWLRSIAYYNTRLPNAQLQTLST